MKASKAGGASQCQVTNYHARIERPPENNDNNQTICDKINSFHLFRDYSLGILSIGPVALGPIAMVRHVEK